MDEIINKIKKKITNDFSGVVTLSINDRLLISEARGLRDINNNLENNIDTKFGIASGVKFFTALGIGKLIDSGMLSLETNVWEIMGDDLEYIGSTATIKHLLSHTSGMYDYLDEELMEDDEEFDFDIPLYKLINPTDYLPLFEGEKPKFCPGEKTSYSNGGFVLLGAIIEKVTGECYRNFITDNIIRPCGMMDTGFYFMNDLPANSAIGYKEMDGKLIANYFSIPIVDGADGGIFSTSNDMAKLWNSFADNKILSEELTKIYMTPVSKLWESDYGLGVYLSGDENNRDLFLYGCDPGVGFHSRFNIKTRRLINILSNRTWGIEDISNAFWDTDL